VLLAALQLAIGLARTLPELGAWWQSHQAALRLLTPLERAELVALKDTRKAALQSRIGSHDHLRHAD
jgi:hypothetical protein